MINRIEQKYLRRISNEIRRAMNEAGRLVADGKSAPDSRIMPEHEKRIGRILTALWREAGKDMSERIAGNKKSIDNFARKDFGYVLPTEQADKIMADWINSFGASMIVRISSTTRKDVKRVIDKGIKDGLGEREIAKMIREVSPVLANSRAQRIARTEAHRASAISAQATAKASGVELKREWVAAKNERTRKSHRDADGQVVEMNQPFNVGGYDLMYPADPSGPAHLTINCRCAVAYIVK